MPKKTQPQPEIAVPIIWILGGPGSGKGTQCEKIREKYGFVHISTGDLLREEVQSGSQKGKELEAIMQKGGLISNEIVLDLLKEAILSNLSNAKGFLIDGYPREKEQGQMFEHKVAPVTNILYFETANETMMTRLKHRALSSSRTDDNETTMTKRIAQFNKEKDTIINQYASKVKKINAERGVDVVFNDVQKVLDALFK